MPVGLVVFDMDGTLLRGDTVCLAIARSLGTYERMLEFEHSIDKRQVVAARNEMAAWYMSAGESAVLDSVQNIGFAPGARECVDILHDRGIETAIVSLTWGFAVRAIANRLGIHRVDATDLDFSSGEVTHLFGHEKGDRMRDVMDAAGVTAEETAAVGDTPNDFSMLEIAAHRFYVGAEPPRIEGCHHLPGADMRTVARLIVEA